MIFKNITDKKKNNKNMSQVKKESKNSQTDYSPSKAATSDNLSKEIARRQAIKSCLDKSTASVGVQPLNPFHILIFNTFRCTCTCRSCRYHYMHKIKVKVQGENKYFHFLSYQKFSPPSDSKQKKFPKLSFCVDKHTIPGHFVNIL